MTERKSEKLTKAQRILLSDLSYTPLHWLPSATRAMARRLRERGLVNWKPETRNLYEEWAITEAGRRALSQDDPS